MRWQKPRVKKIKRAARFEMEMGTLGEPLPGARRRRLSGTLPESRDPARAAPTTDRACALVTGVPHTQTLRVLGVCFLPAADPPSCVRSLPGPPLVSGLNELKLRLGGCALKAGRLRLQKSVLLLCFPTAFWSGSPAPETSVPLETSFQQRKRKKEKEPHSGWRGRNERPVAVSSPLPPGGGSVPPSFRWL